MMRSSKKHRLILLEFLPDKDEEIKSMETELSLLESVTVRKMIF